MIKVLLFAHLQEVSGRSIIELDSVPRTVRELKEQLEESYSLPSLRGTLVSINEEFARQEDFVKSGDVVALIPPVSGG